MSNSRNYYRESLKTSVFRDLPQKNARFAAQRARNCKGTSKNNRFSEVPYIILLFAIINCLFIFTACGVFISGNDSSVPEVDENKGTWIKFENLEVFPVTVYSDASRLNVFAEIAANSTKNVPASPNNAGTTFYPTFHIGIPGIEGVKIPYDGPAIVTVIEKDKTTWIPIPKLESISINKAYINLKNESNFSLSLLEGYFEKVPLGDRPSIIIPGQSAAYEINPGPSSGYSVMRNTTIRVDFPAGLTEFKRGIIYGFTYNGTSLISTGENSILQTIPPDVPENVRIEAVSNTSVRVVWDAVYGATSYRVYRGTSGSPTAAYSPIGSTASLSVTDTNLSAGEIYYYKVSALSGANRESAQSEAVSAIMPPANVRVTATTTLSVTLGWNAFSGADGYNVYRSNIPGGTYMKINSGAISGTAFTDTGLLPDRIYNYKISTIVYKIISPGIEIIEGLLSGPILAVTPSDIPASVRVTGTTTTGISIAWNAVSDSDGYNVYRSDSSGGTFTKLNSDAVSGTAFTDTGLSPNTGYFYKISSIIGNVESLLSNQISAATLTDIPANVRVTGATTISISIEWDTVSEASGYNVYCSDSEGGTFTKLNSDAVSETTFTDTGLSPNTSYYYKVSSIIGDIESLLSSSISTATLTSIPSNMRVTTVTTASISIEWDAVSEASGYNVYRSDSEGGTYTKINSSAISGIRFTDTDVTAFAAYYYKASAFVAGVESELSSSFSASAGIIVPGSGLAAKLTWLQSNAINNSVHYIEITADENIGPQSLSFSGKSGITIILNGGGVMRTVNLSYSGRLFTIGSSVTLILDNNITLKGRTNNYSLVYIDNGGTLVMNENTKITGNTNSTTDYIYGGGVYVSSGTFIMNGGEISGNYASSSSFSAYGGGVFMMGGTFTMNDGQIHSNTASMTSSRSTSTTYFSIGGGVYIGSGTFTMNGGQIHGNVATASNSSYPDNVYSYGGGVFVTNVGTFTMNGGEISGNTAKATNSGTAYSLGGGVYVSGTFRMSGGAVYGTNATTALRNTAASGAVLYKNGTSSVAQYGTFSGNIFNSSGDLNTTNTTIRVVNGSLQNN